MQPYFTAEELVIHVDEDANTSENITILYGAQIYYNFVIGLSINSDNPIVAIDFDGDPVTYYIPNGGDGYQTFTIETVNGSGYLYFEDDITLNREVSA